MRIFLRELKALALLEFIPYEWLQGSSRSYDPKEEIGIDRFGSNSLIDGFGAMLILAIAIVLVALLLIALYYLAKRFSKLMVVYIFLMRKM